MDHLCYFSLVLLCFHAHLFVDALRSPAGKGLTSWLSFVMSNCEVVISHWYLGTGVVLDCINSWSLPSVLLFGNHVLQLQNKFEHPTMDVSFCWLKKALRIPIPFQILLSQDSARVHREVQRSLPVLRRLAKQKLNDQQVLLMSEILDELAE